MTFNFKAFGNTYCGYLEIRKYGNGNMAINMVLKDGEVFGPFTVNICPMLENEVTLDVNNIPEIEEIITKNHLGEFTGNTVQSGYCTYPIYKINISEIMKYRK